MIARFVGASLGLLAFCITIIAGLYVQNPVTVTISRSIFALFIFFILGLVLGTAAEIVVNEHERVGEAEILKRYREEPKKSNEEVLPDISIEDDRASVNAQSA